MLAFTWGGVKRILVSFSEMIDEPLFWLLLLFTLSRSSLATFTMNACHINSLSYHSLTCCFRATTFHWLYLFCLLKMVKIATFLTRSLVYCLWDRSALKLMRWWLACLAMPVGIGAKTVLGCSILSAIELLVSTVLHSLRSDPTGWSLDCHQGHLWSFVAWICTIKFEC